MMPDAFRRHLRLWLPIFATMVVIAMGGFQARESIYNRQRHEMSLEHRERLEAQQADLKLHQLNLEATVKRIDGIEARLRRIEAAVQVNVGAR